MNGMDILNGLCSFIKDFGYPITFCLVVHWQFLIVTFISMLSGIEQ